MTIGYWLCVLLCLIFIKHTVMQISKRQLIVVHWSGSTHAGGGGDSGVDETLGDKVQKAPASIKVTFVQHCRVLFVALLLLKLSWCAVLVFAVR